MDKIVYLEGLRGSAAFIVFLAHFAMAFPIPTIKSASIFAVFWNGDTAVCLFFIISGFVLSLRYFQTPNSIILQSSSVRRYFRLAIPATISIIVAYGFLKFNFFQNTNASVLLNNKWFGEFYSFQPNLYQAIYQGIIEVFFGGNTFYNPVLWTMKIELVGSFVVYTFCALFGRLKYRVFFYFVAILLFWDTYYLGFLYGMILSDLYVNNKYKVICNDKIIMIIAFAFLCIGMYLGSYSSHIDNKIFLMLKFHWIRFPVLGFDVFYHFTGSLFIICSILICKNFQKVLSNTFFKYLGRVSFSFYLIHFI